MCEKERTGENSETRIVIFEKYNLGDGTMEITFSNDTDIYRCELPYMLDDDFERWLSGYVDATLSCRTCGRIALPGESIVIINGVEGQDPSEIVHTDRCSDNAIGILGSYDTEGNIILPKLS